jgi:hypothetical protein
VGGYTRAVSGQQPGKHVPAKQTTECPLLGSRLLMMEQLDYKNGMAVFFYVVRVEVIFGTMLDLS